MQKYSFGSKQRGPTSQPTPRPIIPCIMTASAFQKCYDSGKCCNGLSCEVCQNKHDAKKKSGGNDLPFLIGVCFLYLLFPQMTMMMQSIHC
jgi:hypothetical protein